jgi:uncharacterized damage-inducible protein DinB
MTRSLLADAFDHHVWATLRVMDACDALTPEQLQTNVPGTYGTILDTMRHTVGADCSYLFVIGGGSHPRIDEDDMDLAQLRAEMEANGPAWTEVLKQDLDPDEMLVRRWDDGSSTTASKGLRLAQALHHGTDHRSQVCTALTQLGIEPPLIDLWDFGNETGRVTEVEPTISAPA